MPEDPRLSAAIQFAQAGLSVVPSHVPTAEGRCSCDKANCTSPGKHPRPRWAGRSSTVMEERDLHQWWKDYPDTNVGIVTGKISRLVVIDVDDGGLESLAEIGFDPAAVATPTARSGGGGLHIYCLYPDGERIQTRAGVLHKVDIRADGGFIVAPPSRHRSGKNYEWVEGLSFDDVELATVDLSWLARPSDRPTETRKSARVKEAPWWEELLAGVGEGERNEAAARLAGRYLSKGMDQNEVLLLMSAWNRVNDPPMPLKELEQTVASIARAELAERDHYTHDELSRLIQRAIGIEMISVQRIGGTHPQYVLNFREGSCTMTSNQLLSPASFQQLVMEATGVVVKKLSSKTAPNHDVFVQWINDFAEIVDAGLESTEHGELTFVISDFMSTQGIPVLEDVSEGVPARGCFEYEGLLWFELKSVMQWGSLHFNQRFSLSQWAQRMKAAQLVIRDFPASTGRRTVWGINPEWLNSQSGQQA